MPDAPGGEVKKSAEFGLHVPKPFLPLFISNTSNAAPTPNSAPAGVGAYFGVDATGASQGADNETNDAGSDGSGDSSASEFGSFGAQGTDSGSDNGHASEKPIPVIPHAYIRPRMKTA